MKMFTSNPEAIRPSSFDAFIDNLASEGTREVVAVGTYKETFAEVPNLFTLLTTGKRVTTPVRASNMRFYRIGAKFEANSITGLPIVFSEDYEQVTEYQSGIASTNIYEAEAKTILTIEDHIAQLKSRIPGINITILDGDGKPASPEKITATREFAAARALDAYGKPVQLSFRYA